MVRATGLATALLTAVTLTPTQSPSVAAARAEIQRLIAASGAEAAVVWRPLDARPGEEILINETTRFHAASTMKVPVMIELFRQVDAKRLRLDDAITVVNHFSSIVDGSQYILPSSVEDDGEVHTSIGRPMTLRQLCEAMITISSNLAANNLIEKLGVTNIQATTDALGASGMQVLRGVEDQKAFEANKNNTTDASALATLMAKIGRGEAVSRAASAEMVEILKRQHFNNGIPAGLLPGTPVAHKTGTITKVHHDAAIVYTTRPYVLVVLTRGLEKESDSDALIAAIAKVTRSLETPNPRG
jgi:beta-lactamase class A